MHGKPLVRACRTWFGSRRLCLFRILTHQWMNKAHGRLTLQAGGCSCQGGVPDPSGPCRSLSTGCCPEQGKQTLGCFVSRLILDRPTPQMNGATGDASTHGSSVPRSLRQCAQPSRVAQCTGIGSRWNMGTDHCSMQGGRKACHGRRESLDQEHSSKLSAISAC